MIKKILPLPGSCNQPTHNGKPFALFFLNDELMKQYSLLGLLALATAVTLSSCEVVGGIFKAGMWVGILLVVLVVGLILWLIGRGRR